MNSAARRCVIGVEIGGTKLQAALGSSDGAIAHVARGSVQREAGAAGILAWIEEALRGLLAAHPECAPEAIGVGFGGPVDSATGQVLVSHQIAGWEDVALKSWFETRFGLPAVVANDANAAGWAEFCLGAGRGVRQFFYMNIGSGIGGALVVDGRLYDGQGRGAGEIGHTYVPDWTAAPGAADKLENLCSGWSIERRLRQSVLVPNTPLWELCEGQPERLSCPMLGEAARLGDAFALEEIGQVARAAGLALTNVITLFHPERIALGGGVPLMGDVLLQPLKEYVDTHVFGPYRGRYAILPCGLAESVVVVGALLLAAEAG